MHVMDDQGSIEKCLLVPQTNPQPSFLGGGKEAVVPFVKLNVACLRRFVNTFLAFYRTLQLWETRETVVMPNRDVAASATSTRQDCGICLHHVVAASDEFSKLSMHWDMMPAAKLNYVHDFRGFFNCISQVGLCDVISVLLFVCDQHMDILESHRCVCVCV